MKRFFTFLFIIVTVIIVVDFMNGMVGQSSALETVGIDFVSNQSDTVMSFIDIKVGKIFDSLKNIAMYGRM